MAIFSKTQFPKYQNPIRITRPYIQPNYLADTINSAIQGYGSIQGMNMQQQLFNAKLKAAQDAKAQQELNQATYRQMMQQQMGAPAVNPAPYVGPMGAGPMMLGTPAQPGMNPMQSVAAAMQSNPTANIQDLIGMASNINTLQNPRVYGQMNEYQRAMLALKAAGMQATQTSRANTAQRGAVSNAMGQWGNVRQGAVPYYIEDPENPGQFINVADQSERVGSIFPRQGGDLPGMGPTRPGEELLVEASKYAKIGGEAGWLAFTDEVLQPIGRALHDAGWSPTKIKQVYAIMQQAGYNPRAGYASQRFDYNSAIKAIPSPVVKIMESGRKQSSSSTQAAAKAELVRKHG